jgi:WD40 repeat protein
VDRPGLRTFHDAGDAIWDLAFSPDGTRLTAALEDGSVRLWSFPEGVSLRSLRVRGGAAMALVFPRDDLLVTGSESGVIEAWDPTADAPSLGLGVLGGTALALAFDPSAGRLACAGRGGEVLVLDAADRGPAIRIATSAHDVEALAFSADGGLLAWGGRDKAVHVWDTVRREQIATLEVANGFTQDMAFRSGAAPALVTGGWSATLFWDVPELRLSRRLGCPALELALGAEDGLLVTASSECRVWDLTGRGFETLVPHAGRSACEFEPGGRRLATGDEDGVLRVWDVASARLLLERPIAPERIRSLSFQPGGPLLAAGNEAGSVTVLDAHTGELAFELTGHDEISAASVAFGPAGRLLAHTAEAGRVRVVDVRTRALVADVEADRPGGSRGYVESLGVAFPPEGKLFATTGRGLDRLRLWTLAGALRADVLIEGAPWTPAFSGDGRLVAVTTWSGAVQVLDASSGGTVMRLQEHQAVAWDVAFDPDDPGTLATSSDDGTVKLWDLAAGRRLATLRDHGEFECFAVSLGSGGLLASASRGGVVLRDLSYFQHHVAANLAYQRELRRREPGLAVDDDGLDAWAAGIASRDWPRYDW